MNGMICAIVIASCLQAAGLAAQAPDTGRVETAPGVSIYYERYGTGPRFVLVPNRLFMPEFQQLARGDRTLILYDMRNRGLSSPVVDSTLITIMGDVQDVEALRRHFGAESASLIGYSYLGLMVALYAAEHPSRVERLVQIGSVPRQFGTPYPSDQRADLSTLSTEGTAAARVWQEARAAAGPASDQEELCRTQQRFLAYLLVGNPANHVRIPDVCQYANEHYDKQVRHLTAHFGDIQRRTFAKAQFTELELPVLVVHGTMDRNAPYGAGIDWAATFPDARLVTVAGGAHQVWLDDSTVITDIDRFLSGSWPSRAQGFGRK